VDQTGRSGVFLPPEEGLPSDLYERQSEQAIHRQQVAGQDANHVAPYDGLFHFLHLNGVMGRHLLSGAYPLIIIIIIIIICTAHPILCE